MEADRGGTSYCDGRNDADRAVDRDFRAGGILLNHKRIDRRIAVMSGNDDNIDARDINLCCKLGR